MRRVRFFYISIAVGASGHHGANFFSIKIEMVQGGVLIAVRASTTRPHSTDNSD